MNRSGFEGIGASVPVEEQMALSVDFAQHHTVRLSRELESMASALPGGAKTLVRGFGAGGSIAKECALHTRPDEKVLVADIVKTSDVSSLRFIRFNSPCSLRPLIRTPSTGLLLQDHGCSRRARGRSRGTL